MKNTLPSRSVAIAVSVSLAVVVAAGGCNRAQRHRRPLSPKFHEGTTKLREGDFKGAAEALEEAARDEPLNASVQCNLGIACWKLGRTEQAVEALQRAANSTGCDTRPLEFLGLVLMDAEGWAGARDVLLEAHQRSTNSARILTCLAAAEIRSGLDGTPRLQEAVEIDPDYAPALYNMAVALRDRAAALPVSSASAIQTRARAAEHCKRYLTVMKSKPGTLTPQDEQRVALADRLLASLITSESPPSTPAPPPPTPKPKQTNPLLEQARRAITKRAYEAALILTKDAIRKYPDDPDALWQLAVIYDKHLKYPDSAAKAYGEFRKKFPDDPRAAGTTPKKPVKPNTSATTGTAAAIQLFAKGHEAQKKGDWNSAIDHYKRAIRVDPTYSAASYNLGLVYYDGRRDLEKARDAFALALAQDKKMARAYYMLGLVYKDLKDPTKAIAQLNAALRIQPDYARVHFVLGQVYRAENQADVAEIHLKRYLQYAPQGQYAARARELLRRIKTRESDTARKPPMPR